MISNKSNSPVPQKVTGVSLHSYKGLNNEQMVMLKWDDVNTSNIKSYEIYYAVGKKEKFVKANSSNIIDCAFIHIPDGKSKSIAYKVRAVDYWDRKGEFSDVSLMEY
ncbi:MAG: hypothetical protein ACOC3T_00820 [Bacteroidota bacterium]